MDAEELQRTLRCDPIMNEVTWGIFAQSEFPPGPLLPGAYIVNTTNSPGRHWILIFVDNHGIELYDSLGRTEHSYGLHLGSRTLPYRLQPPNSKKCGLYVLYFLYWRSRGIDMNLIFDSLKTNSERIVSQHYASLCPT